jgi:urea transporter
MASELAAQASLALLVSYVLQWLKGKFPFLNAAKGQVIRWISAIVSILSGIGIWFTWDRTAGVLTIAGLTIANFWHAIFDIVQQWFFQQAAYHAVVKDESSVRSTPSKP